MRSYARVVMIVVGTSDSHSAALIESRNKRQMLRQRPRSIQCLGKLGMTYTRTAFG